MQTVEPHTLLQLKQLMTLLVALNLQAGAAHLGVALV
jgi:hypothetical protein